MSTTPPEDATQPVPDDSTETTQAGWTQPVRTTPVRPAWGQRPQPPMPGQYQFGTPPRGNRMWLIGGGAAAVVALIVVIVLLATSGSDSAGTGGGSQAAPDRQPHVVTGKEYTDLTMDTCSLVTPETISTHAPGATCTLSPLNGRDLPQMMTRIASWETELGSGSKADLQLDLNITVGPDPSGMFKIKKDSALTALSDVRTVKDQRTIPGIGDEAFVYYAVDNPPLELAAAEILVRSGNALITVSFNGRIYGADGEGTEIPQQESEDAVIAVAKDVLEKMG
jgi:hypothetical protein